MATKKHEQQERLMPQFLLRGTSKIKSRRKVAKKRSLSRFPAQPVRLQRIFKGALDLESYRLSKISVLPPYGALSPEGLAIYQAALALLADLVNTSLSPSTSTLITSPGKNRPARISCASGFSTWVWMERFNGRAP